jgi:hypothetical protein
MLEPLTLHQFAQLVGQVFTAQAVQGSVELKLLEASALRPSGVGRSEPFSLIFLGSRDAMLAQGSYALEHDALPGLEVFIVPIGMSDAGVQYQAIFN